MNTDFPAAEKQSPMRNRIAKPITAAMPLAAGPSPASAAPPHATTDMVMVNGLGTLFGYDADPEVWKGSDTMIVNTVPGMVTDGAIRDVLSAGISAVNITIGHVSGDIEAFEYSVRDIGCWDRILRLRPEQLIKVSTTSDILQAKREGKVGVIYGFQNAEMMGDKADRVDIFADLGVRVFQLTYNKANLIGDGLMAPENRGLSRFGREVIERLNARRMLIDLSHSGENTCLDAARASSGPIIISHTGCRALVDLPRNKSDAELKLVADKGGYAGIYFMPFLAKQGPARAEHVVAHIDHAINICGEDHVGIGTDGSISEIPDMKQYLEQQAEYVEQRRKEGVAAPGESASNPFFVVDLTGPDQFRKLARLLGQKGYKHARIEKILGGNFLRVARDVWGG